MPARIRPTRLTWTLFAAAAGLLVAALGWLSWVGLRLEDQSNESRVYWARLSQVQLALWRLDAALTPVLASEGARPYHEFAPFYLEGEAFGADLARTLDAGVMVPSPLLGSRSRDPEGLWGLHFQVGPDGRFSSPQIAQGAQRELALAHGYATLEEMESAEQKLAALGARLPFATLLEACGAAHASAGSRPAPLPLPAFESGVDGLEAHDEFAVRELSLQRARSQLASTNLQREEGTPAPFVPCFFAAAGGRQTELLLLRTAEVRGQVFVQGVWTDWEQVRAWLLTQVRDLFRGRLFEGAQIELLPRLKPAGQPAARTPNAGELERELASLPCTLRVRGLEPIEASRGPARIALSVAWIAVLAAIACVAIVLRAAVDLSERRGRFASAVTHELRTPLTTFCLYSEMLADGFVRDPAAQAEYLQTLKQESTRLRRIVESVLAFARVEEGRQASLAVRVDARALLDGCLPTLRRRAAEAGMIIEERIELPPGAALQLDAQSFEQVLFNLVDNASKYASQAEPALIELEARVEGGDFVCEVADHGPGIPAGKEQQIFQAFQRAVGPDGNKIPGLGLGLALARGLAERIGGKLTLLREPGRTGARFRLRLPLAPAA